MPLSVDVLAIAGTAITVDLLTLKTVDIEVNYFLVGLLCVIRARFKFLGQNFSLLGSQLPAMSVLPEGRENECLAHLLPRLTQWGKFLIGEDLITIYPKVFYKILQL